MEVDKTRLVDEGNRPRTQSLFLEVGYSPIAIYTFKEKDHVWNGVTYYSLKRLYLEMEDPTEYEFACTYLTGWTHWQRMLENKLIRKHIDEWREELEYKLRSKAAKIMIQEADKGSFQAAKWLLDRGWASRPAGRPTKAEIEKNLAVEKRISDDYSADVHRLFSQVK